jgi:hypothetical protein
MDDGVILVVSPMPRVNSAAPSPTVAMTSRPIQTERRPIYLPSAGSSFVAGVQFDIVPSV